MKKNQVYWAGVIGLLSVIAQVSIFYIRFGRWNTSISALDYVLFFLAGALGGLILSYFLNRQNSRTALNATLLAFLLASPIALVMMVAGGLIGPIGVIIFPQFPWALFSWVGGLVGNFIAKNKQLKNNNFK